MEKSYLPINPDNTMSIETAELMCLYGIAVEVSGDLKHRDATIWDMVAR